MNARVAVSSSRRSAGLSWRRSSSAVVGPGVQQPHVADGVDAPSLKVVHPPVARYVHPARERARVDVVDIERPYVVDVDVLVS
jgi:hypothetical protein